MIYNTTQQPDFSSVRLIISDLDGTLLNSEKEVDEITRQAIKKVMDRGIYFTISTGREYAMLEHFLRAVKPNAPVVSNNGGEIVSYPDDTVIFREMMPDYESKLLLRFCWDNGIDFCATTVTEAWFPKDTQMTGFYLDYVRQAERENLKGFPVMVAEQFEELADLKLNKIIVRTDLSNTQLAVDYARSFENVFDFTMSSNTILEIMPYGSGKERGLKLLMDYLKLKKEEVCAIGDYDNDIRMLQMAGLAVVMENGLDIVKQHADIITDDNDSQGVAKILDMIAESRK